VPFVKNALAPGIDVQPLFLDPQNGVWALRVIFAPGIALPKHFHTGCVHLWTMSGSWHYAAYPDQPQTAGCYLYEPGGSIHQFVTPATNREGTDTFMDAGWIEAMINELARQQGLDKVQYIRGQGGSYAVD